MNLQNINFDHNILSTRQVISLVRRYKKTGDQEAASRLIQCHEKLVFKIARGYYFNGSSGDSEIDDLMQWGRMGLLHAAKKFEPERGLAFSTYAVHWIRQYISRNGRHDGQAVAMSYRDAARRGKAGRLRSQFEQENQREPTNQELADLTGIAHAHQLRVKIVSIDAGDDDTQVLLNKLCDTSVDVADEAGDLADSHFAMRVHLAVERLPAPWNTIIRMRFGLKDGKQHSLQDVSDVVGISRETVRSYESKALAELARQITAV